jgi:hypothetical protein
MQAVTKANRTAVDVRGGDEERDVAGTALPDRDDAACTLMAFAIAGTLLLTVILLLWAWYPVAADCEPGTVGCEAVTEPATGSG